MMACCFDVYGGGGCDQTKLLHEIIMWIILLYALTNVIKMLRYALTMNYEITNVIGITAWVDKCIMN